MKSLSYKRIYKSQEYLATLGTIEYRSLFGSYSLTVDDTVFAMVSDGELYLRACEQSAQYCVKHPPVWLTYKKCGRSVTLNYYRVDESLWRNQLKLRSRWHAARSLQNGLTLLRRNRSFLRNLSNLALQTTNLRQ
ncbi:TPA: TfoX/Sxy family protein [Escherichia coli]|nr:TfoX/Sxy family protein [Escherichia coli]MBP2890502.1 TfoX/Sxy family protein [Escherichia coli]HBD2503808.1 TfoX/Sxy family protein [Escherichia coli]HBD2509927.1 TfoX/Sxy family protein [Escherichia coli]HBD2528067.1 TfoX/Sxy family protein [Escherichia coli]